MAMAMQPGAVALAEAARAARLEAMPLSGTLRVLVDDSVGINRLGGRTR